SNKVDKVRVWQFYTYSNPVTEQVVSRGKIKVLEHRPLSVKTGGWQVSAKGVLIKHVLITHNGEQNALKVIGLNVGWDHTMQ
ncbi:MAG: hypothetical protein ACF8OB_00555, partial [Phycisphaeraceae bacterium JB051]